MGFRCRQSTWRWDLPLLDGSDLALLDMRRPAPRRRLERSADQSRRYLINELLGTWKIHTYLEWLEWPPTIRASFKWSLLILGWYINKEHGELGTWKPLHVPCKGWRRRRKSNCQLAASCRLVCTMHICIACNICIYIYYIYIYIDINT